MGCDNHAPATNVAHPRRPTRRVVRHLTASYGALSPIVTRISRTTRTASRAAARFTSGLLSPSRVTSVTINTRRPHFPKRLCHASERLRHARAPQARQEEGPEGAPLAPAKADQHEPRRLAGRASA